MFFIRIIGISILYFFANLGWGAFLLRLFNKTKIAKILGTTENQVVFSFALGQIFLAFLWLIISLGKQFYPSFVWILVITGAILSLLFLRTALIESFKVLLEGLASLLKLRDGFNLVGFGILIFILFSITIIGRPLGDAAELYMSWPKIIASSHRLAPFPGVTSSDTIGLFGEMHYSAMIAMGSPDACRFTDLLLLLIIILLAVQISNRLGLGGVAKVIVLSMLFTSSAFVNLIGKGTTDIYAFILALTAVYLLLLNQEIGFGITIFFVGLFAGAAFCAKFTYVLSFLPVLLVMIILFLRSKQPYSKSMTKWIIKSIPHLFIFGIGVFVGFAPHFIKNFFLFHDPFIAFSSSARSLLAPPIFDRPDKIKLALIFPLALTYGKYAIQSGNISPLLLAFLPFGLVGGIFQLKRNRSELLILSFAALAGLIAWVAFRPNVIVPRYIFASLFLFFFLPARCVERYFENKQSGFLQIVVVLCVLTLQSAIFINSVGRVFLPNETIGYLNGTLGQCGKDGEKCTALRSLNKSAEPGTRVLFASWFNYWLRPDLFQCMVNESDGILNQLTPQGNFPKLVPAMNEKLSINDYWIEIAERGFTYIVIYKNAQYANLDVELANKIDWLKLVQLYNDGKIEVYRIDYKNSPVQKKVICVETLPGAWDIITIPE